ncbi:FAD-binding domain-containing protein [Synechococcus sp. M16CYN]|uniref:FAD-binding domain-containing protein n=1 Tax=Synechococcus sp. M16CYN TaxID=3103139 RepID=UPI00324BDEE0
MPVTPLPPIAGDMPRTINCRDDLNELLEREFPEANGLISSIRGGREAAEKRLKSIDAKLYARSRDHLGGFVTGLSPYIRHGVISLAEVRDTVFKSIHNRDDGAKLINELGWRDFWQRIWQNLGDGINDDQEEFKTGYVSASYSREIPEDVRYGCTGLACMDSFYKQLVSIGWLHNHARMWMAAWLVHWRRVHWKTGADWFLEHLLDGDPASNNLSWQWVASTFSHKPYFFNRDTLERYSGGSFCENCTSATSCPFEGSYDRLGSDLFPYAPPIRNTPVRRRSNRSKSTIKS